MKFKPPHHNKRTDDTPARPGGIWQGTVAAFAAITLLIANGAAGAEVIQVINDKKITEEMTQPVVLEVVGSNPRCGYIAFLTLINPGTPKAQWLLKAKSLSCRGANQYSIKITDAKALVVLNELPVPAKTALELYDRTGK
ncbi:hypothetical protein [Pseudomonas baetica]|uniref:hypothetical protein n=1 Tax=Pseudomonas baetica TaxID=674054 RepID=UPI002405EFC8|nr:hypothetical protein [Pseudomonas baetica]MDF9779027.1 hypothetical protein [Pseudomonas baetica]